MAIFSLSHTAIGKSTHASGTAGAHVDYITRAGAAKVVMAERMPDRRDQAHAWFDQAEAADRKNGRVCDKVMVALPVELTREQQTVLVREFAGEITQGRASWIAAIHDKDGKNPHAHIVIRDKDPATGKRVAALSEKGSTEKLREAWERVANRALEQAGQEARIDHRSLKAQGIERKAQIHVGPKAKAMEARGVRPVSQVRTDGRGRVIRYPDIDAPFLEQRTRAEHNARIVGDNKRAAEDEARRHDLSPWIKRLAEAKAEGIEPIIELETLRLGVAQEFEAAGKPLPVFAGVIDQEAESRWRRRRKAQEDAQKAQERASREKAVQEAAARQRAQTAAADRYEGLLKTVAETAKAAEPAVWQRNQWMEAHPWRARLHRLGLKAGPLVEIEGRVAAVEAAKKALAADHEGREAWQKRKAKADAAKAKAEAADRQKRERVQKQRLDPAPKRSLDHGQDFGMGF